MHQRLENLRKTCAVGSVAILLVAGTGCQTWRSSSVVPSMLSSKGERQILKQAKQESFPTPSDVGIRETP